MRRNETASCKFLSDLLSVSLMKPVGGTSDVTDFDLNQVTKSLHRGESVTGLIQ